MASTSLATTRQLWALNRAGRLTLTGAFNTPATPTPITVEQADAAIKASIAATQNAKDS